MNKQEFLNELRTQLQTAAAGSAESIVEYYDEMICDRVEDGMSEEDAVAALGSIDDIVKNTLLDKSVTELVRKKVVESHKEAKSKGLGTLWVILLVVFSPIWVPVAIVLGVALLIMYITLWVVVIALLIALFAVGVSAIATFIGAFSFIWGAIPFATAIAAVGLALVLGALTYFAWKPMRGIIVLTSKIATGFVRKIKGLLI